MFNQPLIDFHYFSHWHGQSNSFCQPRRQHLIRQHPQMLRIIPKLHDIKIPIGAAHQMSLRPTPHPPNVLNRFHQSRTSYLSPAGERCDRRT
jgi:hypothetical protein